MVLLFSLSSIQSTTPVTSFYITAVGGDSAGDDGGKNADAGIDDADNEDDQHAYRENGSVSPINSNPGNNCRMFCM